MSGTIKALPTLYSNWKISLIILKGDLLYILKKCMFVLIKYVIVIKAKWKTVKVLRRHSHLEAITLIGIGGRCPGVICPGGNYPRRKLSGCNYLGAIFLGGNCARGALVHGVIVWEQLSWGKLSLVGIVRGELSGG